MATDGSDAQWFSPGGATSAAGDAFMHALRGAAHAWSFNDLSADATHIDGLTAEIAVPGLTCDVRYLRVAYDPTDGDEPTLRGEWANEYWFDGPTGAVQDLIVNGIDASPVQYGQWAADWFHRQLSRTVVRQEWEEQATPLFGARPGAPRVASRRWIIGGGDDVLDQNGSWFGRSLLKRPPDRVVTERPVASTA